MATASTSPRDWKGSPSQAVSACRPRCMSRCRAKSTGFCRLGRGVLKNIALPLRVYRISTGGSVNEAAMPAIRCLCHCRQASIAVLAFENMSWRSGAGILLRRRDGRHHHRAHPLPRVVRHRPQFVFLLQGQIDQGAGDRAWPWRHLCGRGQRPQGGKARPRYRPTGRGGNRQSRLGGAL